MGDVSLGLIYSICIINSRFWKVLTGIDRPSRDVFVQTVPFIGLIKSAGFYIGGGGVDKLTSDERKREGRSCANFSGWRGGAVTETRVVFKWNVTITVGVNFFFFSWTFKNFKIQKIDPNLYKVAKAVTGKCSKPQIDAIKAVRKYSCQNFLAT